MAKSNSKSLDRSDQSLDKYLKEIGEVWKDKRFEKFRIQLQNEFGCLPSEAGESVIEEYYNAVMNKRRFM